MIISLPRQVTEIFEILKSEGYVGYLVGGCVRDSLLGKLPSDWDISTSAPPERLVDIFAKYHVIPTGLQHGTVTVVMDNMPFEITTFRIDGAYTDCRRPDQVSFTDDVEQDLSRRDFTINACCYNDEHGLIDPFGGADDLKCGLIRCVGEADLRFREDGLRILRGLRFAATLGFKIEQKTQDALLKNRDLLHNISHERLRDELNKLICGRYGATVMREYREVIFVFIPELRPHLKSVDSVRGCDTFEQALSAMEFCTDDLVLKLTVLFKGSVCADDGGKSANERIIDALKRLKYDNKTVGNVRQLVKLRNTEISDNKVCVKRLLSKFGEQTVRQLLDVRIAEFKACGTKCAEILRITRNAEVVLEDILANRECFSLHNLQIDGGDLISLGYEQGREVGATLDQILHMVMDGKVENERQHLLRIARSHLGSIR